MNSHKNFQNRNLIQSLIIITRGFFVRFADIEISTPKVSTKPPRLHLMHRNVLNVRKHGYHYRAAGFSIWIVNPGVHMLCACPCRHLHAHMHVSKIEALKNPWNFKFKILRACSRTCVAAREMEAFEKSWKFSNSKFDRLSENWMSETAMEVSRTGDCANLHAANVRFCWRV